MNSSNSNSSRMSGKHSRTKGHQFERDIAKDFQELGWEDAMTHRAARGGEWSTTDGGIDIVNVEPFAIQCKRFKGYAPISCIEEIHIAITDSPISGEEAARFARRHFERVPLLLTKADGKPTMAVLPWSELKKLLKDYCGN